MGKTVVVYESKYGSTKKYAQCLAQEIKCDLFERSEIGINQLTDYENIVYGGGLYASGIAGISLITKNYEKIKDKNIMVFTVGLASTHDKEIFVPIIEKNFSKEMSDNIKFFHLRGRMDYSKLSFMHKTMMKMLKATIDKKKPEELTGEDKEFLATYGEKIDFTDRTTLQPLILHINKHIYGKI